MFISKLIAFIFLVYLIFSASAQRGEANSRKFYDYWASVAKDAGINHVDIVATIGRLSASIFQEKGLIGYLTKNRTFDQILALSRTILNSVDSTNETNEECRNEIQDVLYSMATMTYELANSCEMSDLNATEFGACNRWKRDRIKEHVWIATMFNAWGTFTSGLFAQGQFLWYGSYHQCVGTKVRQRNFKSESARYCLISIGPTFEEWALPRDDSHDIGSLRLQLGACLPPSCVEYDSSELLILLFAALANVSSVFSLKAKEALSRLDVFCQPTHGQPLNSSQIAIIVLICVFSILIIAGTIIEYRTRVRAAKRQSEKRLQRLLDSVDDNGSFIEKTTPSHDWVDSIKNLLDLESVISFKSQESLRRSIRRVRWWRHLVTAYSIRMNVGWLASNRTSTSNGERPCNRITCLYGIRVITMVWVIAGHSYVFALPHLSNLLEATERMPVQFLAQLILNASLSVDTFFLISGLLTCYMWCLRQKKSIQRGDNRTNSWLAFYGHRYSRLVPPYAFAIAFVVSGVYSSLGCGPKWNPSRISGVQCDRNTWWRHLLFINNLVPGGEHCLPWMWHLAIDVQCYLVAPIFIIALWKRPKVGIALIVVAVLASALARGLVVGLMRLPTNLMPFLPSAHYRNDFHAYFDMIYQKPYFRCGPYLVGLLAGWILATKTEQLRMWHSFSWKRKALVWLVVLGCCFWPLFGLFSLIRGDFFSPAYNGVFAAVNRTLWSVGVALVIVSCHCQFGCSYLNAVLSWIGWWPFARLNYSVYLIHELLIVYVYFNLRSPIVYDGHVSLLAYFAFFTAASYCLALILFVMAEGPVLAAERLLFRRKPHSKDKRAEKSINDHSRRKFEVDRQRMTERWSICVAAGESELPLSGTDLYQDDESKTAEEIADAEETVVEADKAPGVESSMGTSITDKEIEKLSPA